MGAGPSFGAMSFVLVSSSHGGVIREDSNARSNVSGCSGSRRMTLGKGSTGSSGGAVLLCEEHAVSMRGSMSRGSEAQSLVMVIGVPEVCSQKRISWG